MQTSATWFAYISVALKTFQKHALARFYIHEYNWWNLVDVGDAYLELGEEDQEMVQRIGNEVGKLMMVMKDDYCARAFRLLAFTGVGNLSMLKTLLRYSAKGIHKQSPKLTAEVLQRPEAEAPRRGLRARQSRWESLPVGLPPGHAWRCI